MITVVLNPSSQGNNISMINDDNVIRQNVD